MLFWLDMIIIEKSRLKKILCPKLGDLKFWSHTRISRILKCEIKGSLGSSYLLNHKSYSQANKGLTPYLAGQKYAIRFYD